MQVLGVCSTKGGAGKTTIATNLAVAAVADGLRVAMVDLDPQQSMAVWWEDRGRPNNPMLITWPVKRGVDYLPTALERSEQLGFDLVIIDTPPAILGTVSVGVKAADVVLIPSQASAVDLIGNKQVMEIVAMHRKDFVFLINRAEPRDSLVDDAMAFLKKHGEVIATTVGNRKAFRVALGLGKAAPEIDDVKAGQEIAAVWADLKKRLRAQARKAA